MSEDIKAAVREQALIGILERLANEMEQQDVMLEDLIKRHENFVKSSENAETYRRTKLNDAEKAHDKLFDSFHHYRSDMLSLVNEQDRMNKSLSEMQKLVHQATYAVEESAQKVGELEERVKAQEKAVSEHYEHSLRQAENFPKEIAAASQGYTKLHADTEKNIGDLHQELVAASQNYTKLHADTEKNIGDLHQELADTNRNYTKLHAVTEKTLGDMHRDTQRHLDKLEHDTLRRLLMLDSMEIKLQTLLVRTEPQVKKKPWVIRLFKGIGVFFRVKIPSAVRRLFSAFRRFFLWIGRNDL
jgi:chromosome segregation ATPase